MTRLNIIFMIFVGTLKIFTALCVYLLYIPFYLPNPTGDYAVGRSKFHWIDTSRKEPNSQDPHHPYRELMVKTWYPTQKSETDNPLSPYAPLVTAFNKEQQKTIGQKFTALMTGMYRPMYAHYAHEVRMAPGDTQFPILIFSHGFGETDDHYSAYCSELASHGYVVFSINHTYDCTLVNFPDGRCIRMIELPDTLTLEQACALQETKIETWMSDVRFVLDCIEHEALNPSSTFYQKLDIAHIGILGHSFGGSTAIQCCRRDSRFKAGCNLDGPLYGSDYAKVFSTPFMFIHSQKNTYDYVMHELKSLGSDTERNSMEIYARERFLDGINKLAKSKGQNTYNIDFEQATHFTFCDLAIIKHASPLAFLGEYQRAGALNGFKITAIINKYLVSFFDRHLKNMPSGLILNKANNINIAVH